jgi:hypothetical protein
MPPFVSATIRHCHPSSVVGVVGRIRRQCQPSDTVPRTAARPYWSRTGMTDRASTAVPIQTSRVVCHWRLARECLATATIRLKPPQTTRAVTLDCYAVCGFFRLKTIVPAVSTRADQTIKPHCDTVGNAGGHVVQSRHAACPGPLMVPIAQSMHDV